MADQKVEYGSSSSLTITLAGLATSSTFVAGRTSLAVDNSGASDKFLNELLSGTFTVGATPAADSAIKIYLYGSMDDVPNYPNAITGANENVTITELTQLGCAVRPMENLAVSTTASQTYDFSPKGIASYFGGTIPKFWGVFVSHNTNVNLASGSLTRTPVYRSTN